MHNGEIRCGERPSVGCECGKDRKGYGHCLDPERTHTEKSEKRL